MLPRLRALGADLERVFLLPREDPETGMPLRFPHQVDVLAENLTRTQARLVVIDPIVAFLAPSVNTSKIKASAGRSIPWRDWPPRTSAPS